MSEYVTALDLGGSHVVAGRVHLATAAVERGPRVVLPPGGDRLTLLECIVAAATGAGAASRLACAVPGPFDYAGGVAWMEHKLESLYGVAIGEALAAALALPPHAISFVNDADAFLLGEAWVGAAAGHERAVGVTLGTGLGSAFLADGRIVRTGSEIPPRGEIHLVSYRGRPVEETISRGAVVARYGEPGVDVEEIAARARAGDVEARSAFANLGSNLGEVLRPWLRSFRASCLVVGGSIARAWALFEGTLIRSLDDLPVLVAVRPATRLDDAALLGAARHASEGHATVTVRRVPSTGVQVEAWRARRRAAGARPLHLLSIDEARAAETADAAPAGFGSDDVVARNLDGPVPIRLFQPQREAPSPVCVWLPGGGWVLDTLPAAEPTCRELARETPYAVAAVRYRLAPEHRFPAPLEDVVASIRWLLDHADVLGLDPTCVAVGGASAGANLAAATTLVARGRGGFRLAAQVLVYPVLAPDAGTRSRRAIRDPDFFGAEDVDWCWSHYLSRSEDARDPRAAPLLSEDLSGLPPALVVTAELDPLCDEGELYAERLRTAGVPVQCIRFASMPHGFLSLTDVDAAAEARKAVGDALRSALLDPTR